MAICWAERWSRSFNYLCLKSLSPHWPQRCEAGVIKHHPSILPCHCFGIEEVCFCGLTRKTSAMWHIKQTYTTKCPSYMHLRLFDFSVWTLDMCFTLNMLNIFKTEKMLTLQNLNCAGFPPDHDPRQCGWGPLGADFPGPNGTMSVEICQELVVDDQEKLLPECWSMAFSSWEWTCDCTRLIVTVCVFIDVFDFNCVTTCHHVKWQMRMDSV